MIAPSTSPPSSAVGFSAIFALGVSVGLVLVLAQSVVRPVLLAFAFGGIILLIPTFVVRDPRAYWLFLLVLSMAVEIAKSTTSWLAESWTLLQEYGPPASSVTSLDFYLTDVVLFAMLLPWLARLCLRRDSLYFPKIGYIFILYLVWALMISLIYSKSLYLSIFEWCRQVLYFLSFVYFINNVVTRSQLCAVVLGLLVGLVIEAGTVITLYKLDIGTETFLFSGVYREHEELPKAFSKRPALYAEGPSEERHKKRSGGTFGAPVITAYYLEFILPIALAYLVTARRVRDRFLLGALFASGCIALYMTFSRTGLVGFVGGTIVFFVVAGWSRLISVRGFTWSAIIVALAAVVSAPWLISSFEIRAGTASRRLDLIELALRAYWQQPMLPILGGGLNNSTIVIKEGALALIDQGRRATAQSIHCHYVVVLTEVGLVGFLLFYTFFGKIVAIALRSMRAVETETKLLLVGIVGGLSSVVIHNLGDGLAGHSTNAILWLYAALIITIARRLPTERALSAVGVPTLRPPDPNVWWMDR